MTGTFDHVLAVGFGGPTGPEEIAPFLAQVARGARIPEARLAEVAHHYGIVGGCSRYNAETLELIDRLRDALRARGAALPVYVGMRNWHPFLGETLGEINAAGLSRGLGLVLAPHRCEASFERYLDDVDRAKAQAGAERVRYAFLPGWHAHPDFIAAQADLMARHAGGRDGISEAGTALVFSAHAIPVSMPGCARYVEDVASTARACAAAVGASRWQVAYQSRSGNPREPWLEPDVETVLRRMPSEGIRRAVVVPIGFLCENVEVLFDLDIEASGAAREIGLEWVRVPTVRAHPAFVGMLAGLVADSAGAVGTARARSAE
ncbi:MAG TPA: ferrochelatase [bacterium]